MYKLRPYQRDAVEATLRHFKSSRDPAVIVLPTGAGKSLVISELARIARGRVLVLAHVKELVEQNHGKYESYGHTAGIYAAGLKRKDQEAKVIFGSIQSVARAKTSFFENFSLLIVDECHRISLEEDSQYLRVIGKLKEKSPKLCLLGLTATPYRLGLGWIFEYHYRGFIASDMPRFFKSCIYELPLKYMIDNNFLTPPLKIDAPVACYDFSQLKLNSSGFFSMGDIQSIFSEQKRVTPGIINHIISMSSDRAGVMIFTSSVQHAKEILQLLPKNESAIVVGETDDKERDQIIHRFKARELKFLVNVSVLTTGFDAPHVDLIAMLRPTESVSLYQQIIGRGLRLYPGKEDCLVLDYTGLGYDIFRPEIEDAKPTEDSEIVTIVCPQCSFENTFWGRTDGDGHVAEHFGRRCKGAQKDPFTQKVSRCDFRFRFKICESCGAENDIAARACQSCSQLIIDADQKLKKAMELKDAHVMRPDTMLLEQGVDRKQRVRLEVAYYDLDGQALKEYFYFGTKTQAKMFYFHFTRMHTKLPGQSIQVNSLEDALMHQDKFRMPKYIIARKKKYYWEIREKIF